jgi:hypothetical protein
MELLKDYQVGNFGYPQYFDLCSVEGFVSEETESENLAKLNSWK